MSKNFACNGCGACCQSVNLAKDTQWLDRGDGTCRNYHEASHTCRIYEDRPEICRVNAQYEKNYANQMGWEAFCELNSTCCRLLFIQIEARNRPTFLSVARE